ncbi:hypothetical protein [Streptomyces sp. NPDC016675]|uniref:hypothetical protein n=1 Tax=Streptomyces sp. NPDC016675 TaxID=3364970 RepID=UPI0036FD4BEA
MLSLDGNVLCFPTTWEQDISTSVLTKPHRSQVLRRWAEAMAEGTMDEPDEPPLSLGARLSLGGTPLARQPLGILSD